MQDNNKTPKLHAPTHELGGSDVIPLDTLGIPTDNTGLNATDQYHGLLPKLVDVTNKFLDSFGRWTDPTNLFRLDDWLVPRDITNLNVTDQYHGLVPKLTDVTNQFFRADGVWAIPPGGGGGGGGGGAGSDTTAWHVTGDTITSDSIIGATSGNFVIKLYCDNKEWGRLTDLDGTSPWTGPRLLVGITTAIFQNADAISIGKTIAGQLGMSIQNKDSTHTANSGYYLLDDTGAIGGLNILNSGWPNDGSDTGVFPHEVALLTAGTNSNLVLGTTYQNNKIRFIANNGGSAGVTAIEIASLKNDITNSEVNFTITGNVSKNIVLRATCVGNSGSSAGLGAYWELKNSDGATGYLTVLESGAFNSYAGKNGFVTMAGGSGLGLRFNVNGANDSGFSITTSGAASFFNTLDAATSLTCSGGFITSAAYIKAATYMMVGSFVGTTTVGDFSTGQASAQNFSFLTDTPDAQIIASITSKSGFDLYWQLIGKAGVGTAHGTFMQILNTSNQYMFGSMPETGWTTSALAKANWWTFATSSGVGFRINVGGANDSGLSFASNGDLTIFSGNIGFFSHAVAGQQTVGANVNNIAASGTTGQFDDFTSLTVYATDAQAIHNSIYQLARSVKQHSDALRNLGLGA